MRLSRNRRWGHPDLLAVIEELSVKAARNGWNGLMVGDMSQPRGGPMLTGHASHQVGLDADIWFMPMPARRLTYQEREETKRRFRPEGRLLLCRRRALDGRRMPRLLREAAAFAKVERILVHPGVKKKLCETVTGNRAWLAKIRPYDRHNYHFHLRIGCPQGSPGCKVQRVVAGEGCDKSLDWWFEEGLRPKKPRQERRRRSRASMALADLPPACAKSWAPISLLQTKPCTGSRRRHSARRHIPDSGNPSARHPVEQTDREQGCGKNGNRSRQRRRR